MKNTLVRSVLGPFLVGLVCWLLLSACAAPTEIKLNVYTDLACADTTRAASSRADRCASGRTPRSIST